MTVKEGKTHCLKRKHLKNGKENHLNSSKVSITKNGGWNRNTPICTSSAMAKHRSGKLSIHPTSGWHYPTGWVQGTTTTEVVGWIYGDTWLGLKENKGTLLYGDKNRKRKQFKWFF